MNALQTFMQTSFAQVRDVIQETFTVTGETPAAIRYGTFGDPQVVPLMTRQGYQDTVVIPLKSATTYFASAAAASAFARGTLVRTSTGRSYFIQAVDYTEVDVYTFLLTDREL